MSKEINLLPRKNIGFLQQEKTIVGFRILTAFSVIFLISSGIGVFFLQKNYSIEAIQAQQTTVTSRLSLLHDKTVKVVTLSDRIKKITTILKSRSTIESDVDTLQKQVPAGVTIDSISVSKKDFSLSITSSSLKSLQNFIDKLTDLLQKKKLIQKLTIDNILINQQAGTYSVNIHGVLL